MELKRPNHELTKDDLNQMEDYLAISEKYSTRFRSYKAYLMGSSISDEVKTYLRYRKGFDVLNYWEVLEKAETRYKQFLKYRENIPTAEGKNMKRTKNTKVRRKKS